MGTMVMILLSCLLLLWPIACEPGDTFQWGDQLCTYQHDHSVYCEPLHGDWEVR